MNFSATSLFFSTCFSLTYKIRCNNKNKATWFQSHFPSVFQDTCLSHKLTLFFQDFYIRPLFLCAILILFPWSRALLAQSYRPQDDHNLKPVSSGFHRPSPFTLSGPWVLPFVAVTQKVGSVTLSSQARGLVLKSLVFRDHFNSLLNIILFRSLIITETNKSPGKTWMPLSCQLLTCLKDSRCSPIALSSSVWKLCWIVKR